MHELAWELREIGIEWDGAWDALAGECAEAGFMQSSGWAAFKRAEGYETRRFGLFEGDNLRGGATFLLYSVGREAGFVLCPEGPVLRWEDTAKAREGLRLLLGVA